MHKIVIEVVRVRDRQWNALYPEALSSSTECTATCTGSISRMFPTFVDADRETEKQPDELLQVDVDVGGSLSYTPALITCSQRLGSHSTPRSGCMRSTPLTT
jgi:hypothetical protein